MTEQKTMLRGCRELIHPLPLLEQVVLIVQRVDQSLKTPTDVHELHFLERLV